MLRELGKILQIHINLFFGQTILDDAVLSS